MKVLVKKDSTLRSPDKVGNFRAGVVLGIVLSILAGVAFKDQIKNLSPGRLKSSFHEWAAEKGHNALGNDGDLMERLADIPGLYMKSMTSGEDLPQLNIDIAFKPYQKLFQKREEALQAGVLVQGEDDFVPAKIRIGDSSTKVKLRLKGDWTDHLEGNKWSLRIHTKGKNQLFSLRRFSIQHPRTRGYQAEALFYETLSSFGVITPQYFFVNVVINGEDIGVMALEEHFSKELLERNGRKEGVIVRFDERLVWEANDGSPLGFGGVFDSYLNAKIDAFQSSKIRKSKRLEKEYQIAVGLLRAFDNNEMTASEVFDVQQMGSYLAVAEFMGSWHALRWHNLRFYLNPLTMKLEPVAFDANLHERYGPNRSVISNPAVKPLADHFLRDERLRDAFTNTLNVLKDEIADGTLVKRLQAREKPLLAQLRTEYFLLSEFDYDELQERAENLSYDSTAVDIRAGDYPVILHAYTVSSGDENYLELASAIDHPVKISRIFWKQPSGNTVAFKARQEITYPLTLQPTYQDVLPGSIKLYYQQPSSEIENTLHIEAGIAGDDETRVVDAETYYPPLSSSPMPRADLQEMLRLNEFIELDEGNATVRVKSGNWEVHGSLVVPAGYRLEMVAGTTLQFAPDAGIVSYGPTHFSGTADAPIMLEGMPSATGSTGTWQGIAVHGASERSQWRFVNISNTTGVDWPLWSLTGGVTFYKSDVDLHDCIFDGNNAEDALNIVHAGFELDNISILNTASDGFDGDYVNGVINGGVFENIGLAGGGDGIDFSGSVVEVDGARFVRVDDKAVSAGEGSRVTVTNISVEDSGVGAASKDRSELMISESTISGAHVAGLMAYVKKPEYGPAALTANNLVITNAGRQAVVQTGSRLTLNGETIEPDDLDIEKLYQTVMKPGLRK